MTGLVGCFGLQCQICAGFRRASQLLHFDLFRDGVGAKWEQLLTTAPGSWNQAKHCPIEVGATYFLGMTHAARGEFSAAATLLERNVALEGDLRYERFGTTAMRSAVSGAHSHLADVLSQLGLFDEAIEHAEAAVRIAEATDHPFTLYRGLIDLGRTHLRRGDLPRATRVLERGVDLCRTWQIVLGTPLVAAALGAA